MSAARRSDVHWSEVPTAQGTCPVSHTLDVVAGKWTLLVVRELLTGTKRFTQLRTALDGVNPRTLSERLKQLEWSGIVSRRAYAEVPPRVEYTLTERGRSLEPVLEALAWWGVEDSGRGAELGAGPGGGGD